MGNTMSSESQRKNLKEKISAAIANLRRRHKEIRSEENKLLEIERQRRSGPGDNLGDLGDRFRQF